MKIVTKLSLNLTRKLNAFIAAIGLTFNFTTANAQTTSTVWSENRERTNWSTDWSQDAGAWQVGKPMSGPDSAHFSIPVEGYGPTLLLI